MQIVREVERDILRREQQKREEEALIDEVNEEQIPKSSTTNFEPTLCRLRPPGLLVWRS